MKTIQVTIDQDAFDRASTMAERRGLATANNPGVSAIMKMALKAYLNKYSSEISVRTPSEGLGMDKPRKP